MKNQLFKLLLSFSVIGFLVACKKNVDQPPPDPNPLKKVKQVASSPLDFTKYEYDLAGNVTKYISQWENGGGGVSRLNSVYEYNGNKLVRFSNEAGYGVFTYNGTVVGKSDNFAANGKKLSTIHYQYNSNGKITSLIEQIANPVEGGAIETKVSYQYHSDGNVSRIDFADRKSTADPFVVSFSKVFIEYDNKKNPVPDNVIGFFLPGVVLQKNNPVRINNVLANGTVEGYSRYEYTYNTSGYPVKRKQFIAIGNNEQAPFSFDYSY